MKDKKTFKERVEEYKEILQMPDPEVDKLLSRSQRNSVPPNMAREEEIAWILQKADEGE
jgi:hypothetical protein